MDSLKHNKSDLITSVAKSAVGAVPFAGTLLSELVGAIIPNQRIDRLTKYVKELEQKISLIPDEVFDRLKTNEQFIDLIEESFVIASRAITDERRKYIASIIANGITNNSIEIEESKLLLKILQELNDIEIIWLRFYKVPTVVGDEEFRKKHNNILSQIRAYVGSDKETMQKAALQESYKNHLERLGLIRKKIRIDPSTKIPEFDIMTGQPRTSYARTTQLGDMLLEQIGLIDNEQK